MASTPSPETAALGSPAASASVSCPPVRIRDRRKEGGGAGALRSAVRHQLVAEVVEDRPVPAEHRVERRERPGVEARDLPRAAGAPQSVMRETRIRSAVGAPAPRARRSPASRPSRGGVTPASSGPERGLRFLRALRRAPRSPGSVLRNGRAASRRSCRVLAGRSWRERSAVAGVASFGPSDFLPYLVHHEPEERAQPRVAGLGMGRKPDVGSRVRLSARRPAVQRRCRAECRRGARARPPGSAPAWPRHPSRARRSGSA